MLPRFTALHGIIPLACAALLAAPAPAASGDEAPSFERDVRPLLAKRCAVCHNQKLTSGGVSLADLDFSNVAGNADVLEKVLRKVHSGEMPPAGMPHPDASTSAGFTTWLQDELDREAAAHPNPGRPTVHRLNRAEYSNAIRDLLALDIKPGAMLPADDTGYGFDNIGDVLSLSPMLIERYMSVARQVTRLATGLPPTQPALERFEIPLHVLQDDRQSEDLPLGSVRPDPWLGNERLGQP